MSYADDMRDIKLREALRSIEFQLKIANEMELCKRLYNCDLMTEDDYKSRLKAIRDIL